MLGRRRVRERLIKLVNNGHANTNKCAKDDNDGVDRQRLMHHQRINTPEGYQKNGSLT